MSNPIGLTEGGENASDTIAAGGTGAASAVMRPIGISPSINTAPNEDWFRGNQWPPENTEPPSGTPAAWHQSATRHFTPVTWPQGQGAPFEVTMPPRAWDPQWYQMVLLSEFARAWAPTLALDTTLTTILTTALQPANLEKERRELKSLIEFRANLMSEAVAQMNGFEAYFQGALFFHSSSHPSTHLLYHGAMRAADLAVMHYKNKFQRPRPSQLWPDLMPPIAVPGHAAFPSGHATQANTAAAVLAAVAGAIVPDVVDVTNRLAQRIARGREVLGLHYPSDSAAGAQLAAAIVPVYLACPTVSRLVLAARREWQDYAN